MWWLVGPGFQPPSLISALETAEWSDTRGNDGAALIPVQSHARSAGLTLIPFFFYERVKRHWNWSLESGGQHVSMWRLLDIGVRWVRFELGAPFKARTESCIRGTPTLSRIITTRCQKHFTFIHQHRLHASPNPPLMLWWWRFKDFTVTNCPPWRVVLAVFFDDPLCRPPPPCPWGVTSHIYRAPIALTCVSYYDCGWARCPPRAIVQASVKPKLSLQQQV